MLVMDQANKNFKNPRVGLSGGGGCNEGNRGKTAGLVRDPGMKCRMEQPLCGK